MERTDSTQSSPASAGKTLVNTSKKEMKFALSSVTGSLNSAVRRNTGGENTRPEKIFWKMIGVKACTK